MKRLLTFTGYPSILNIVEVSLELSDIDLAENDKVAKFVSQTCGCKLHNGNPCSMAFPSEHIKGMRDQCSSLSHSSLDYVLIGQIMANTSTSNSVCHSRLQKKREVERSNYYHHGIRVKRTKFV